MRLYTKRGASSELPFVTFALVYVLLGVVVGVTLWRQVRSSVRPTTGAPASDGPLSPPNAPDKEQRA